MSKITETPLYTDNLRGGDVFILTPTKNEVYRQCAYEGGPLVKTVYEAYWKHDDAESKKNYAEYAKQMKVWRGEA